MRITRTPAEARDALAAAARPLGLVPTMGALHAGHRELVRRARAESRTVAASVFVNPLQFGPGEDFDRYPRSFDDDVAALRAAGVDLLYAPDVAAMYPPGFSTATCCASFAPKYARSGCTVANSFTHTVATPVK